MFEKSLYDLIRGLRNHRGNEREYIQESLRECRKEIRSNDMDLKATALLKLTYLEMFGYDMSWASFNVLEVMSSQKYHQKRIGYLAAVQSYRPDTEVLMLAENQLKKDLTSSIVNIIVLPLAAIPHVISSSMANSLLPDILPRLTHSNPSIRKKTIVTLYRLALVYPETLRPAWPKIKERLLDDEEDPSVTAAIVNVVCELGWRRPQDFLPLAPRLFDLLVQGGNNWMAIKIIKLFATLTPLEPRLVKKLVPPLTTIIKTTPAMSLLYECISGIIQGGILDSADGTREGEEIARLCVGKLRAMLVVEGDPNLKFVALLAFEKIVRSHQHLVALHRDVILDCIDDPDISIRMRTLDLLAGLVNSDNLPAAVGRLMRQLQNSPQATSADYPRNDRGRGTEVTPSADSDDDDATESLHTAERCPDAAPPLPDGYRTSVIRRILEMCSHETYANVSDFEWYIDILMQLVRLCPATTAVVDPANSIAAGTNPQGLLRDVSYQVGIELQNVAVRVRSIRAEAVGAAQALLLIDQKHRFFPTTGNGGRGVIGAAAWISGEYAEMLTDPESVLNSLLRTASMSLPDETLAVLVQSIPKVFAVIIGSNQVSWTRERSVKASLLIAKILHSLEPLAEHPSLEIQERAVEYLELMRLAAEAVGAHPHAEEEQDFQEPPLLLTQAIPMLFNGEELNPIAPGAQKKVPLPTDIHLDIPINQDLETILQSVDALAESNPAEDAVHQFYNEPVLASPEATAAADRLRSSVTDDISYQQSVESYQDDLNASRTLADRKEKNRDDPFYIATDPASIASTPIHNILKTDNGDELDIDSIPVMDLDLDTNRREGQQVLPGVTRRTRKSRKPVEIIKDETLGEEEPQPYDALQAQSLRQKPKRSPLEVDTSGLRTLSLEDSRRRANPGIVQQAEEAEMAKALKEVERLRLEMQRASERIQVKDSPPEGTVVKRKKKKARTAEVGEAIDSSSVTVKKKKKAKKTPTESSQGGSEKKIKKSKLEVRSERA